MRGIPVVEFSQIIELHIVLIAALDQKGPPEECRSSYASTFPFCLPFGAMSHRCHSETLQEQKSSDSMLVTRNGGQEYKTPTRSRMPDMCLAVSAGIGPSLLTRCRKSRKGCINRGSSSTMPLCSNQSFTMFRILKSHIQ